MKHFACLLLLMCMVWSAKAQTDYQPDISRYYYHYQLDEARKSLLAKDGLPDTLLTIDTALNNKLTYQANRHTAAMQKAIELSQELTAPQKIAGLRGLAGLLNDFGKGIASGKMRWQQLPPLLDCFDDALQAHMKAQPILAPVKAYNQQIASQIANNKAFEGNSGLQPLREYLLFKTIEANPGMLLKELGKFSDYPFTDSLISVAARTMPEELLTYAQAQQTVMGKKIAALAANDSMVGLVLRLSKLKKGQLYLPFIGLVNEGQLTWDEVTEATRNPDNYFKLLVRCQMAYNVRAAGGHAASGAKGLAVMLKQKSYEGYVNVMNGLHHSPAGVRFKCVQQLSPAELYYLIVLNEESIFTSSYMYVYNRIFSQMKVKRSDSLLQMVHYDRYKKFLTMASNYNTLNHFLGNMGLPVADSLMTSFVSNLEKGLEKNDVEDAVDVANAYASISNAALRRLMLGQVKRNLEAAMAEGNQKAIQIYHIEKLVMESSDSANAINITDSLGIPPVYGIKNGYMRDTLGRIVLQMFFLDDGTGKGSFNVLNRLYSNRKQWAVENSPYWVKFTSIGTPVPFILFANRALDAEQNLDELAQKQLVAYMQDNGFEPSIVVHRGHSFSLGSTIKKLPESSKVVVLGSCGAYQNLSDILKICPDAYIISSKQVGIGEINIALFQYLVQHLKMGHDIQWPTMMADIAKDIARKDGYDDYIFPHRNLGALFIKAYKSAMGKKEE